MKRRIELKSIREKVPGRGEITFDYREVLVEAARSPGMGGLTVGQVNDRLKLLDILEAAEGQVVLSKEMYELLVTAFNGFRFAFVLRAIQTLEYDLLNAEEVDE